MLILPHLAGRIFGTPLAIQSDKADHIMSALTPRMLGEMKFETTQPVQRAQGFDELSISSGGIAVIQVHGTLVKRASFLDSMSGLTSYSSIEAQLQAALQAPEVSGILLSFDSPGGEVNGMVDAADMIFQARGEKPIWALADDGAFSAAYGLASAAEKIFIPVTGEVGSVGVLAMHRNQAGHDEKAGLSYEFVFAGAQKVDGNPHEPLSEGARGRIQQQVNATHAIFTDMVAKHRGTTWSRSIGARPGKRSEPSRRALSRVRRRSTTVSPTRSGRLGQSCRSSRPLSETRVPTRTRSISRQGYRRPGQDCHPRGSAGEDREGSRSEGDREACGVSQGGSAALRSGGDCRSSCQLHRRQPHD